MLQNIYCNTFICIALPDNEPINSALCSTMPLLSQLLLKSKEAAVLLNLHNFSLISLEQLCNNDCKVVLHKNELNIYKDKKVLLKRCQNPEDAMWEISIVESIIPNNFIIPVHLLITENNKKKYDKIRSYQKLLK